MRKNLPGRNCLTHPDEFDKEECNCELIAFQFPQWDEGRELNLGDIDHISEWAMYLSCVIWIEDSFYAGPETVSFPLGDGRRVEATEKPGSGMPTWPFPVEGDQVEVALIVRQRVEEPEDPQLGRLLENLPAWEAVERRLDQNSPDWQDDLCPKRWEEQRKRTPEYLLGPGIHWYENRRESLTERVRVHLRTLGLPSTRGTDPSPFFWTRSEVSTSRLQERQTAAKKGADRAAEDLH